ncbi:glycine zipper 2TM domain-containing protein [Undibacterium sp.]|jgi:outer membrane lipoprotein SlyB|uniref:glycine zipper 2TM domain-containing protein n=1 Tax=Undibacterium sp. TaxID=1914977 RepID=UPI002BB32BD6|nr:glycine zipper 2TM domain-containing protein [Undibacterium sp.]HTD05458.1 glycine zipper 2TM domain-containing protein [Undibacterium sp.]
MENNQSRRIHPLVAGAAVSVTLVSLIGVAAITGVLPSSMSKSAPADPNAGQYAAVSQQQQQQQQPGAPDMQATAPQSQQQGNTPAYQGYAPNNSRDPQGSQPYSAQVAQASPEYRNPAPAAAESRPAVCKHCGRVESIQAVQHQAQTSGLGVAAGAVLGGVLGHQIGHGNGNALATVAGAVGGGYAGNEVEKRSKTSTSYIVKVRMDDGKVRSFPQDGWRVGDRVREVNGKLVSEG